MTKASSSLWHVRDPVAQPVLSESSSQGSSEPYERIARVFLALVLCVLASACSSNWTATPLPEPPAVDGERIHLPELSPASSGRITIVGDPRSVSPGATVRVTNLETTDEPFVAAVESDGSFAIDVEAEPGDELRLDAVNREGRSEESFDYLVADPLLPSPRHDCLALVPNFVVAFAGSSDSRDLLIQNFCDSAAIIDDARARRQLPEFTLSTELPLTVEPGGRARIELNFAATSDEEREDILFLDVDVGGEAIRYPIGLYAPPRR